MNDITECIFNEMNSYCGDHYAYKDGLVCFQKAPNETANLDLVWQKCHYSFFSTGTELWQISRKNAACFAGYMAVGKNINYVISPTPHGASFNADDQSNLYVNGKLNISQVCLARFQLIAAVSILNSPIGDLKHKKVSIVGSGPVAIGAAFELLRQDCIVKIITKRASILQRVIDNSDIQIKGPDHVNLDNIVIDCVGTANSLRYIIDGTVPGASIGLLGSPRNKFQADFYKIHRKGLKLTGLHELNSFNSTTRQSVFDDICKWISNSAAISSGMFKFFEGSDFEKVIKTLQVKRPVEPFIIFKW